MLFRSVEIVPRDSTKVLKIRIALPTSEKEKMISFLRANQDVFAWKKSNWRMCVDFTDLNMAYLKDSFPLPRIDQLADSTARHKLLSFMDAFSGYNQILMDEDD